MEAGGRQWCSVQHSGLQIWMSVVWGLVLTIVFFSLDTLSRSTQVYKWVPATYCWNEPCNEQASHPGGSRNTLSCFMLQKPGWALVVWVSWLRCSFTLPYYQLTNDKVISKHNYNANTRHSYVEGEGVVAILPPVRFFVVFLKRIFCQHLPSSAAVLLSKICWEQLPWLQDMVTPQSD